MFREVPPTVTRLKWFLKGFGSAVSYASILAHWNGVPLHWNWKRLTDEWDGQYLCWVLVEGVSMPFVDINSPRNRPFTEKSKNRFCRQLKSLCKDFAYSVFRFAICKAMIVAAQQQAICTSAHLTHSEERRSRVCLLPRLVRRSSCLARSFRLPSHRSPPYRLCCWFGECKFLGNFWWYGRYTVLIWLL